MISNDAIRRRASLDTSVPGGINPTSADVAKDLKLLNSLLNARLGQYRYGDSNPGFRTENCLCEAV
jgi:hypothetical protein